MPCVSQYTALFKWLRIRKAGGKVEYCCGECLDHNASGKWSKWRLCDADKFKKSDLSDHQKAIDTNNKHKFAMVPVDVAFRKIVEKRKEEEEGRLNEELSLVTPLADLALTLAVEEVALHKSEAFAQWGERHGLNVTQHWRSKNYGWEFVEAAHSIQLAETKEWLRDCKYGVIVDETTDVAITKQIILYVKAKGQSRYVGLRDMHGEGTGEAVKEAVVALLESLDVPRANLVSFTSDGASAMLGKRSGAGVLLEQWAGGPLRKEHCVVHRINLVTGDLFDGKSCSDASVIRLAADCEACVRNSYLFFNRSTSNREELIAISKQFGKLHLPKSWCETRWLSRYAAMRSLWLGREAVLEFLNSNIARRYSQEAEVIIRMLGDEAKEFEGVMDTMRVLYLLSIRLQKANMNVWEVHLHYQRADRAICDLIDDMDSPNARSFAKFMRERLRVRIPAVAVAQEAQVHDFRLLNPESEAAGHPPAGSVFSKRLVKRAARGHWSIHSRHYSCSEEDFLKAFKKTNRRLAKSAHVRNIYNEQALLAIELNEKPEDVNLGICAMTEAQQEMRML
ncbi:hypothetical protein FOZ63_007396 [Perkinsus olseni]|uniref:Uncharacterized protein n=1 Tax=Perkinsus olseni TaxID=32597 RepID=A0A7J6QBW1_PEROL|nr:hypothetical protein FOZ62_005680 [Perkinsus olseni]KAF4706019.1 hypothetical protein FOZ63_007396 [Perkinsus olseni]